MNDHRNAELVGIIEKQLILIERIHSSLALAMEHDVPLLGRTGNAAVLVAGLIENYYTCLETAFQKISQHFENHLETAKWHSELLLKMTLKIAGARIPAVSEGNYGALLELQKFRHFRRYYFELEYDWDRLDFILRKLEAAHPIAVEDLRRFADFVKSL
ncbi:MAG: hypothetical protein ABSF43_02335 [Rectinemataceae bacterium]|jgi:hypothetical protein